MHTGMHMVEIAKNESSGASRYLHNGREFTNIIVCGNGWGYGLQTDRAKMVLPPPHLFLKIYLSIIIKITASFTLLFSLKMAASAAPRTTTPRYRYSNKPRNRLHSWCIGAEYSFRGPAHVVSNLHLA